MLSQAGLCYGSSSMRVLFGMGIFNLSSCAIASRSLGLVYSKRWSTLLDGPAQDPRAILAYLLGAVAHLVGSLVPSVQANLTLVTLTSEQWLLWHARRSMISSISSKGHSSYNVLLWRLNYLFAYMYLIALVSSTVFFPEIDVQLIAGFGGI
jgi:hypothetical protein